MRAATSHSIGRCVAAVLVAIVCAAGPSLARDSKTEPALVYLDQPESTRLFADAAKVPFWPLVRAFESERLETYCAVASGVMVLNALGVPSPPQPLVYPYHRFDQDNFFSEATLRVMPAPAVAAAGMTLDELAATLRAHGADVAVHHTGETPIDAFRAAVRAATSEGRGYVIVNLWRAAIGQAGPGHFSPIGAYHAASDRLLVLDVARYKYAPWWIATDTLWQAMSTTDPAAKKTRGFLVVTEGAKKARKR